VSTSLLKVIEEEEREREGEMGRKGEEGAGAKEGEKGKEKKGRERRKENKDRLQRCSVTSTREHIVKCWSTGTHTPFSQSVCCLLVLDSVTSTPQWIRARKS
jgi:hypothetical protein